MTSIDLYLSASCLQMLKKPYLWEVQLKRILSNWFRVFI